MNIYVIKFDRNKCLAAACAIFLRHEPKTSIQNINDFVDRLADKLEKIAVPDAFTGNLNKTNYPVTALEDDIVSLAHGVMAFYTLHYGVDWHFENHQMYYSQDGGESKYPFGVRIDFGNRVFLEYETEGS